jgi:hypothetical protein
LSIVLCDVGTWTIQKVGQKYLGTFEMKKYYIKSRRTEISYTLQKEGRLTGLVKSFVRTVFSNMLLNER